jgi:hypothetical protein
VLTADAVETGRANTDSDDVDNNDNSERDDGMFTDDTDDNDDNDDNDEDAEDLNSKEDTRLRTLDLSNRTIHTNELVCQQQNQQSGTHCTFPQVVL